MQLIGEPGTYDLVDLAGETIESGFPSLDIAIKYGEAEVGVEHNIIRRGNSRKADRVVRFVPGLTLKELGL